MAEVLAALVFMLPRHMPLLGRAFAPHPDPKMSGRSGLGGSVLTRHHVALPEPSGFWKKYSSGE